MSFDPKDFRRALGKFPTGVTVITTRDAEGNPIGMTASSFNTLSIDPALVLWSIDKGAYSLDAFAKGKGFAINVLRSDQVDLSNGFARRGEDKFANVSTRDCDNGAPLLPDTAAWFACNTWEVYEGGDHLIIVGQVTAYHYEDNVSSLVFHNGRYAVADTHPAVQAPTQSLEARGFLGDYLLYQLRQTLNAYAADFYPQLGHFGVTTEEWRVMTLLADGDAMPAEQISHFVSQPLKELADTGEWLQEKGLLNVTEKGFLLTEKGRQLAAQLLDKAIEHERQAMACLSDEEQQILKASLKRLQQGFAA
ncbi:flavin reductase [Marinobacterium sp. AK62]|uniref:Flavin reductase n=1 Tax=Marinobacterium alkalitolerans TaxID=1542925 RepID=A0ABS3ZB52_9GAMM|nr:flavin reductase [Marinobacterium alkalitolerans]MBP0048938.1 flavin reductase [Marinobacterium alkalitolerans]